MTTDRTHVSSSSIDRVLAMTPSVERVAAIDRAGAVVESAGGPVAADAGAAVLAFWDVARRAAAQRSPSPLDHVVARTTVGGVVVLACADGVLAALPKQDVRPDRAAYELRRAAAGYRMRPASTQGPGR